MDAARNVLPETLDAALIAPCGMNCGLCRGYVREKNPCPGCSGDDESKPGYCVTCKIKTCEQIASGASAFCFECESFPCTRLRQLDKTISHQVWNEHVGEPGSDPRGRHRGLRRR